MDYHDAHVGAWVGLHSKGDVPGNGTPRSTAIHDFVHAQENDRSQAFRALDELSALSKQR
jgi:hypothetical protein